MALSDVLIELLSFSKTELAVAADRLDLQLPRAERTEQAEWLAQQMTLETLRDVADEFVGSGRSALSWVLLLTDAAAAERGAYPEEEDGSTVIDPDSAATGEELSWAEVETALVEMTGEHDPFSATLRPQSSSDPALVNVQQERERDLLLLTFVVRSGYHRFVQGFVLRKEPKDEFFHVMLRPSRGVLEIRADGRTASRVVEGWIKKFAAVLGRREQRLSISFQDVLDLRAHLNARLDKHDARHEDEDDGYGRHTVTANGKYPDLGDGHPRFEDDFAGTDALQSDLLFVYTDASNAEHDVRLRISTHLGTIRCMNHVSNEVMQFVYDAFRSIRAARVAALSQGNPPTP